MPRVPWAYTMSTSNPFNSIAPWSCSKCEKKSSCPMSTSDSHNHPDAAHGEQDASGQPCAQPLAQEHHGHQGGEEGGGAGQGGCHHDASGFNCQPKEQVRDPRASQNPGHGYQPAP